MSLLKNGTNPIVQIKTILEFSKFSLVGFIGFLINASITVFLTEYLGVWYLISYSIGLILGWLAIFWINVYFTFDDYPHDIVVFHLIAFITVYAFIAGLNTSGIFVLTSLAHLPYLLSMVVITAATGFVTFYLVKHYIFHH